MPPGSVIAQDQFGNPFSISIDSTDNDSLIVLPAPGLTPTLGDNSIGIKVLAMIASALRLINVLASGEMPSNDEQNDALVVLNQMIDGWNADRLAIYTTSATDFNLVANKQSYTYGTGGDFNTNRPARIDGASAILLDNPSNPIEVPICSFTVDEWQTKIPVKATMSTFPQVYYDDGNFPLRTISLWPIPSTSQNNFRIYSWQALGLQANLLSTMAFPPGYSEAFRFNLAVLLAPEFGAPISPIVTAKAIDSLARLKAMNAPELLLRSDLTASDAGYNYKADMFGIPY